MNPEQQQAARQEILQRLYQYCWAYDTNDMTLLASVFTELASSGGIVADSELGWGPWHGKAAIVAALSDIRESQPDRRRHVVDTCVFDALSTTRASARLYVSIFSYANGKPPHLVTTGEYRLRAVNGSDGWRLDGLDEVLDSAF
ncbi:nuclear transport factor 2 family protein [Pseudomonas sp. Marseille-P9899]|uniref:nuclear transport factor 2 family protein n=1 Tax=Pseudomonas sp. Marseille-P9899 TaxID=2730401 RepID=UPI00158A1AA2|nr:nuclear transport factor 2 family protein [Pseudomonas sp. Marseille-P9899]